MKVLAVVVNNWAYMHTSFSISLFEMMKHCKEAEIDVDFEFVSSPLIDLMRSDASILFLKGDYDYLVMFDADMIYPEDTIERLVDHDVDIVAGLSYRRLPPHTPCVYTHEEGGEFLPVEKSSVEDGGLIKVGAIGAAGICIKREVIEKMDKPCFKCNWEGAHFIGEDVNFCKAANELGFEIYLDADLQFGHLTQSVIKDGKAWFLDEERDN